MFSLAAPFVVVLFFLRALPIFMVMGLLLLSGLFITFLLLILFLTKETKYGKGYYLIATVICVSLFILFYQQLIKASDRIFFSVHKSSMVQVVSDIKQARIENKLIEIPQLTFALVDTLEDGTIVFTLDGMLDNCVGIAYSEDNANPGYTNCGRIIEWRKVDEHWFVWYTT